MNKFYQLLGKQFDSPEKIVTEIINLEAILNLPKGTEHFVSDLHGEFNGFLHVLRNGSGNVREKIELVFGERFSPKEMDELATLIYYPEEKCALVGQENRPKAELHQWYVTTIEQLVEIARLASSKYSRSKVRKAMPTAFSYVMEELFYRMEDGGDKTEYYHQIYEKIVGLNQAEPLIIAFAYLIQRLVVDHLHVVGDIYDRGPAPDKIMKTLMNYHSVDIQWGNHDLLWLGAAAGSWPCLANVLRICARYDNLDLVEDVYGINLRPLVNFAEHYYEDNPAFSPRLSLDRPMASPHEVCQITKIHQAMAMIQFKVEMPAIRRRPSFFMAHRLLLDMIDVEENTIKLRGETYPLVNTCFQLVNPHNPQQLLPEEQDVMEKLSLAFRQSEKLKRHMDFLMEKGSLYTTYNENLIFHGCIPLEKNGAFRAMEIDGKFYAGKDLLDAFERHVRQGYDEKIPDSYSSDLIWYLWSGENSSLFGKRDMTTFERYFIDDPKTHEEEANPYFFLRENKETCHRILEEFGLDPTQGHIVNGHTPVQEINGENPIKAEGKLIVIDGGFSKPYQPKTGIAGYTLLSNSYGMQLAAHQPFWSKEQAIINGADIVSTRRIVDQILRRKKVRETNIGKILAEQSADLQKLLLYLQGEADDREK